jgi:ATP-binding cassette subfamily B protein
LKELRSLKKYIWKYKYQILIGFSCILLTNYFLVYIPEDIKKSTNLVVDYLSDTQNQVPLSSSSIFDHPLFNKLGFQVSLIFIHAILQGLFLFVTRQTIIVSSRKIEYDLKNTLYQH